MTLLSTSRTSRKTPSDLKWLLNERASVAGELAQLQEYIAQLESRLSKLVCVQERLTRSLTFRQERLGRVHALLRALDVAVAMAHPSANPEAAGVVKAWAGRYGKRGSMRAYLESRIKDAGTHGVTTADLIDGVISQFQLIVRLSSERQCITKSVQTCLALLKVNRAVEATVELSAGGRKVCRWRWRAPSTLDELRALADAGEEGAHELRAPMENPARGEVGGQ